MPVGFIMRERKGVNLDGRGGREDLGGVRGGETVIGIYCKKNHFQLKMK